MSQPSALASRLAGARRLRSPITCCLCLALACVWALASVGVAQAAPAQRATSANSVAQQAVQLDSPAVTRIVSVVNASLTCTGCASDGSDIHSPSDGSVFTYYSSGSGAFITPDGAILTADHVVDHSMNNSEDVAFVEQQAAQDISTQYNVTADQALQYLQAHPSHVAITFKVIFQKAFLSTAYTGNLPDTKHVYAFAITSTVASSPVGKQDTAIVRIDTSGISPAPDFPYLSLSNRPVNALDNVTAIAFPADADLALNNADFTSLADVGSSDVNTINSLLSPSVNTGTITKANEIRPDGTPVYEASSIASNGSSGGPVINDNGEVIGFVDAGPATDRLTFIIPSAVVETYITQAGMSSGPQGRFMSLWTQALGEYNSAGACHWTNATNDLTTLKRQYPAFGGAAPFLAQARQSAAGEHCATRGGTSTAGVTGDVTAGLALIGGCAVAFFALILGVIFLFIALARRRQRRKPAPAVAAPYAAPYPPAPYPSTPYPSTPYPST
ncbi:MAG TPA: trypsin-like peptidase domain-containing protein, partial [Ktedonobacterales bacterium]